MGWNPKAWFTWQGKPTPTPSLWECHESCIQNAVEAAEKEARLQKLHDSLPPGDQRLTGTDKIMPLKHQIAVAKIEQAHWRVAAREFEQRARDEGANRLAVPPPSVFAPAPPHPKRLPFSERDDPDDISTFAPAPEDPALVRDAGADELEPGEDWTGRP